uniref:Uncharacterized protein n=1 Tax=Peronospora matthiolae TaxID=2874970 RepID=A0AAV1UZZ9_9STRA
MLFSTAAISSAPISFTAAIKNIRLGRALPQLLGQQSVKRYAKMRELRLTSKRLRVAKKRALSSQNNDVCLVGNLCDKMMTIHHLSGGAQGECFSPRYARTGTRCCRTKQQLAPSFRSHHEWKVSLPS